MKYTRSRLAFSMPGMLSPHVQVMEQYNRVEGPWPLPPVVVVAFKHVSVGKSSFILHDAPQFRTSM